ncbi:DUF4065 domain-containing protein [Avibacterium paragallinarum]|uniref:Panacea domain-containing protein n=1 Tax=Avibacterium paragallinarum TaxID=728 RepID=UPI0021F72B3A|nr:type II toxin-antitoxin system antitoxin SocA domain-containing protein [Avibacterium paragallinarum]UXN34377.1 DUF4065 domain-containing protein [Avibacterium paragallinarum]
MAYSAMQIANAFIQKAQDGLIPDLTPMKLQKLMFFAQSWYLKRHKQLLIDDNFVRWQYGPVIPSVYYEFSSFGSNIINQPATNPFGIIAPNLTAADDAFIDEVIDTYGAFDGWKLSVMTHQPKTAWSMGELGSVISSLDMYEGKV